MVNVIAMHVSRFGGRLDCGHRAPPGTTIFKVDTGERGGTTLGGNGYGGWWCAQCVRNADKED